MRRADFFNKLGPLRGLRNMAGRFRHDFDKLNRLPPYVLAEVIDLMKSARRAGEDIVDRRRRLWSTRSARRREIRATIDTPHRAVYRTCARPSPSGTSAATASTWTPRPERWSRDGREGLI